MCPQFGGGSLTVTDATSLSSQDIVEIEVAPQDLQVEVNAAIEDGLRYLYQHQWADGRWRDYGCDASTTAMAVLAFENQGHLPINDYDEDIYAEYVQAGLDFLTLNLRTQSISVQTYGDPEEMVAGNMDGNGLGVYPNSCYTGYETGMVILAMVGSGPDGSTAPDLVAPNGPVGIVGRTYRELVVDMVDYCAWAQNEAGGGYYRGGWRYNANYPSSDNSVSQWSPIGMEAAETNWGISAPDFVKSELELWINNSQYLYGGYWDGAFKYTTSFARDAMPSTGAGLCELAYCDISQSDPRFQRALAYLERAWGSSYNLGFYYSMYGIAKGCRIAVDDFGELSEVNFIGSIEWYPDYTQHLVAIQNANGSWPTHTWGQYLDDSWALLVLQKTIVGDRPVAIIDAPTSVPPDFLFDLDGSGSFHMDPNLDIVEWLWDFDKSDGVDWNSPDAMGSIAGGVSYSLFGAVADTFVVTLKVTDNSNPEMTDIAEHIIIVNFENHPPIADAGGPYSGKVGELICFDGTGSVDPDEAVGDYIASYAWDIDGDGQFDDCFDAICCQSWSYEYSGYIGLEVTDSYGGESADTSYVTIYVSEYDVYLATSDISFSNPNPQSGEAITISAIIHCGLASDPIMDDVLVRFYDGDPDVTVHQIGDDQVILGMMAGDAIAVAVDYVVGDTVPREIFVRVDPRDDIEEYDEDNNEAIKVIEAVLPVPPLALDIIPGSCPNVLDVDLTKVSDYYKQERDTEAKDLEDEVGVLLVAILGTDKLGVWNVDPATVRIERFSPIRSKYEDVSTPVSEDEDPTGDHINECECNTDGPDGNLDLLLQFRKVDIIAALGDVYDSTYVPLTLTGNLLCGTPFELTDCVLIVNGLRPIPEMASKNGDLPLSFAVDQNYPNPFNPSTTFRWTMPESGEWEVSVYNITGQLVEKASGLSQAGTVEYEFQASGLASGMYFYRVTAGDNSETRKMILLK
ncbi:MAG: hypothetical protein DRP45_06645 [Candidatus Zixiibacteriota bacterium]|nr:MAG: hypothetical protein DRP45_06645 [candidate division Zixibacteria bacterium]